MARASLIPVGDAAALLRPADPAQVPALLRALDGQPGLGVRDLVPGADSLLIVFEEPPLASDLASLARLLEEPLAPPPSAEAGATVHRIPVVYDGPDLDRVARHAGIAVDEVIRMHAAADYRVAFVGFQPGFAYLSGLPPRLRTPRLDSPRPRVPAGSLGIGGEWTGFYPFATPGGWNLVGRTDFVLFDPQRSPPVRLAPGDLVRMVAS